MSIDVSLRAGADQVDAGEIAAVLEGVLAAEGASLDLSVVVVDDERIHQLNRRFLGHDRPTDVIAFDLADEGPGADGEIVVSWTTACREAEERGINALHELLLYCVHGTLHLLGYDDRQPTERATMHARQRELLERQGYEVIE